MSEIELKESDIQKQIVDYLRKLQISKKDFIFFSVPNEAFAPKRGKLTGQQMGRISKLKRMGMTSGVADLIIGKNEKMFCMEVKRPKGRQSENQKKFETKCQDSSIPYEIVFSFEQAMAVFNRWGIV